ncbi:hypothetical protein Pmani_020730 [Petrolisthes manimaculis]|uniref:Uncharacterized protein n=1 Tax=Petrolisthes manimaculis TaxID=1843537 RepID=A0AAE1U2S0_9EUCA|nr:hypothetical protein Pmani_020730 [Petrolisthes manimaculis]
MTWISDDPVTPQTRFSPACLPHIRLVRVRCRLNAVLSVTQHCISFLRRGGGRALGHLQADSALCHGTGEVQNLALCQA